MYQIVGPYSRDKMRVLLSLDANDPRTAPLVVPGSVNREFLATGRTKILRSPGFAITATARVFQRPDPRERQHAFRFGMLQHFLDGSSSRSGI